MKYEETVAATEKDRKKMVIYIILGFVLAYILMNVYAALQLPFGSIAKLAFIGIGVSGIYFTFRHGLNSYIYRIADDVLLFLVNSGKYDKILCEVEIAKVRFIEKGNGERIEGVYMNAAKTTDKASRYTCVFTDANEKMYKLVFEPSMTYLEKVKELGIEVR